MYFMIHHIEQYHYCFQNSSYVWLNKNVESETKICGREIYDVKQEAQIFSRNISRSIINNSTDVHMFIFSLILSLRLLILFMGNLKLFKAHNLKFKWEIMYVKRNNFFCVFAKQLIGGISTSPVAM